MSIIRKRPSEWILDDLSSLMAAWRLLAHGVELMMYAKRSAAACWNANRPTAGADAILSDAAPCIT